MQTKLFFWLLGMGISASVDAQQPSTTNTTPPSGINAQQNLDALGSPALGGSNVVLSFDTRYKGFLNSPYLLESWVKGDLLFKNGTKYSEIDLKLNTYSDQIIVRKRDTGDSIIVDKDAVKQFMLVDDKGQQMFFRKLTNPETKLTGFFHVLYEGKQYNLLAHYKKTILQADYKGAYSAGRYYDEFLTATTYYLVAKESSAWTKLKTNEKAILKALNDEDGKLKNFVKANNLNLAKSQEDIVRLIQEADRAGN
ncbi:hypothetical protein [Rhodoflexus sp.]